MDLEPLLQPLPLPRSPCRAIHAAADSLEQGEPIVGRIWLVRKAPPDQGDAADAAGLVGKRRHHASAWPRWFRDTRQRFRRPVLYLLRTESVGGLASAILEAGGCGVFCNDAESFPSRWHKGVQPAVPIWLSTRFDGTPYDPATGAEAQALLRSALALCESDGGTGLVYLSAHDGAMANRALSEAETVDAFKGMYRVRAAAGRGHAPGVRLLGAGQSLVDVLRAADLLRDDWSVDCEVWSCPSFTRLARDADAAERWNMTHPLAPRRPSHLQDCLADSDAPVVAVTGYPRAIAEQIRPFVSTRFMALGSEWWQETCSMTGSTRKAQWIAALALGAMSDEAGGSAARAEQALRRYGLS